MNLDELRTVQSKERRKDSLQHLRDSFYEDVAAYIEGRKGERERAASKADDPFSSPEVSRLTDEIETAEEVVEAVYERRVGKVVKLASFAAADMPVDDDGMTAEERSLFDDLVSRIERNKTTVLDTLAGERAPTNADGADAEPDGANAAGAEPVEPSDAEPDASGEETGAEGGVLADAMGTGPEGSAGADAGDDDPGSAAPEPAPDGTDSSGGLAAHPDDVDPAGGKGTTDESAVGGETTAAADRTTVRITKNVGEIFGVDEREYSLEAEDVVTLPTANAEPLLERDAAERLD
ncbi:DNA replication complex subunit Gins51 [Halegenticoccus tardaugens]|uniref:DNA replication complex subunit Gins51 n=1 Tax=Halegenticoccus tardaugens TaxID=2071624 RepID=UPI00100BF85E|nr:hypothetical protein [Halegenticoccus tardaugens]